MSVKRVCYGNTYIKIGTIRRRLAWPPRKNNTQIREAFQIFSNFKQQCSRTLAMLLISGMQLILLSAGTSYFQPRPAVGISCCWHGRGESDQMASTSVPPQAKGVFLVTRFKQSRCSVTLACFLQNAYIKIGTIQKRLAWQLRKDDTQIREAFQIFSDLKRQCSSALPWC